VRTPAEEWSAPIVIDCAGPHADEIGAMAGVEIPSKPYRRQVMVTEPLPILPAAFPLIVDLDTGFYVHRQGLSAVLMGGTDKDLKPGHDTTVDWEAFDAVFRAAAHRVPPLAEAQVMRLRGRARSHARLPRDPRPRRAGTRLPRGLRLLRARVHARARHRHPDDRDAP
jgi:sarcosine oxidase subunit beta